MLSVVQKHKYYYCRYIYYMKEWLVKVNQEGQLQDKVFPSLFKKQSWCFIRFIWIFTVTYVRLNVDIRILNKLWFCFYEVKNDITFLQSTGRVFQSVSGYTRHLPVVSETVPFRVKWLTCAELPFPPKTGNHQYHIRPSSGPLLLGGITKFWIVRNTSYRGTPWVLFPVSYKMHNFVLSKTKALEYTNT